MTTYTNINPIIKDTSVTIIYDVDIPVTGQIEYGSTTLYGSLSTIETLSYWHSIEISNLIPGTTYNYRIISTNYKGITEISDNYTLTTRTTLELESVIRAARINGDLSKTYYVKNGGSNANNGLSLELAWETPYYAAQVAEAGDTILVTDGTYSGYVGFGFYVTPVHHGIPEAPIVMKTYSGNPHIIDGINIRANYITIDGFVVRDINGHGIDVRYAKGIKILNSEVYNSRGSDGIYFRDNTYSKIENCTVHDTGWNGIGIKPTSYFPFPGHHLWVRNSRTYDIMEHNAFDVHGDYMTFENCDAKRSLLAPMGLVGDHVVINNFTGKEGNNGIAIRASLANSLILNNTLDAPIMRQGGVVSDTTFYNNYVIHPPFGILFVAGNGNLIEENEIISSETWEYTYGFEGTGDVTIRNEKVSPYRARSISSATITVEYTDGRIFSVNDAGEYSTYTWSGGTRTIKVVGWTPIGNISGIVTDAGTGLGIEGATVTIERAEKSATTSSNGLYTVANVPVGTEYNVTCTATIYQDAIQSNVVVNEGKTTIVDFTLIKETISPYIITHSPNGDGVAIDTTISATFSEEINKTSAENALSIAPSVSGSFSWHNNKMIFNPDSDLDYLTTYTVDISTEVEDLAGNNMLIPYKWQFTTGEQDLIPPVISNIATTNITDSSVTITWTTDELSSSTVKYGISSGSYIQTKTDVSYVTSHYITLTKLALSTTYYYVVSSTDRWGNLKQSNEYSFTTLDKISSFYDDFLGSNLDLTRWILEDINEGYTGYSVADSKITWTKTSNGVGWQGKKMKTLISLKNDFNVSMMFNWSSSSGAIGKASLKLYDSTGSAVAFIRFEDYWGATDRYENYANINGSSYEGYNNLAATGQAVVSLVRQGNNITALWDKNYILNNIYTGEITNISFEVQYYSTYSGAIFQVDYISEGTTGSLSGTVKNSSDTAISGATVSDGTRSSTTDLNGNYLILNIPVGIYDITCSAANYKSNIITDVQVVEETRTNIDFILEVCPISICTINITQI